MLTPCLLSQVDYGIWVMGVDCNVSSPGNVDRLADAAQSAFGNIDVWINNAGCSGSFQVASPWVHQASPGHLRLVCCPWSASAVHVLVQKSAEYLFGECTGPKGECKLPDGSCEGNAALLLRACSRAS